MNDIAEKPYLVLARKYRPQNFDELIGQDALVRTLKNAIERNRIAHAYMLTGVRGVGKTTTARIIAKALNYTGPDGKAGPTAGDTSDCEICKAIAADRHPDVLEMDAASRTGVDDVREIIENVRYAPSTARYKIFIIDEVHMLSKQAFNALLKTLEEPPPHIIFIFATTEIRKVPVTVLSRCQRFDLRRIEPDVLIRHYRAICDKEGVEIEDEALAAIARAADGSVRDGLSLLDQAIAQADEKITARNVEDMLGLANMGQVLSLLKSALKGDCPKALDLLNALYKSGNDPVLILQDCLETVHILTKIKALGASNAKDNINAGSEHLDDLVETSTQLSIPSLGRAWQIMLKGLDEAGKSPDPQAAAEMTIIKLAYAAELPDPAKLVKSFQDSPPGTANGGPPTASGTYARGDMQTGHGHTACSGISMQGTGYAVRHEEDVENAVQNSYFLHTIEDIAECLEQNREIRLAENVREYIHPVGIKQGRIEIGLSENAPSGLAGELGKTLGRITNTRWIVSVTNKTETPTLNSQKRLEQKEIEDRFRQDPLVKNVMETFPDAEIISISKKTEQSE